ncbi:MAG: hypothetical protein QXL94_04025 [Candidatus Parvarchaeum sp.]
MINKLINFFQNINKFDYNFETDAYTDSKLYIYKTFKVLNYKIKLVYLCKYYISYALDYKELQSYKIYFDHIEIYNLKTNKSLSNKYIRFFSKLFQDEYPFLDTDIENYFLSEVIEDE